MRRVPGKFILDMEAVGNRIREARRKKGWSIPEASKRAKMGTKTWSKFENGKECPKSDYLALMALTLDVSADFLLFGDSSDNIYSSIESDRTGKSGRSDRTGKSGRSGERKTAKQGSDEKAAIQSEIPVEQKRRLLFYLKKYMDNIQNETLSLDQELLLDALKSGLTIVERDVITNQNETGSNKAFKDSLLVEDSIEDNRIKDRSRGTSDRGRKRSYTDEQKDEVFKLWEMGWSRNEIAKEIGIKEYTVGNIIYQNKRYR